jgi:cephalosporin hydroxylase
MANHLNTQMHSNNLANYSLEVKFNIASIDKGHHKMFYHGVPMIKSPFDYAIYQMLIWELQPDLIIEIGTNLGGSAFYYANILDSLNSGIIHTIDILDLVNDKRIIDHPRIKRFHKGFQSYDLSEASGYNKILIIDDGSHMYQDVKDALIKFNHLVSVNSYFIVEDGIIDELGLGKVYEGGPNRAIRDFLTGNSSFEIDLKWTNFFGINATFNTNGFLKKIN